VLIAWPSIYHFAAVCCIPYVFPSQADQSGGKPPGSDVVHAADCMLDPDAGTLVCTTIENRAIVEVPMPRDRFGPTHLLPRGSYSYNAQSKLDAAETNESERKRQFSHSEFTIGIIGCSSWAVASILLWVYTNKQRGSKAKGTTTAGVDGKVYGRLPTSINQPITPITPIRPTSAFSVTGSPSSPRDTHPRSPSDASFTPVIVAAAAMVSAAGGGVPVKERVQSLDVFRGANIALMIFVDMCGASFPSIHHSPWNGIHLADFVMPWFDFIVGVSLAISFKRFDTVHSGRGPSKSDAMQKAFTRFAKIFILGVLTQCGVSLVVRRSLCFVSFAFTRFWVRR
jgi:hypothetical protein